MKSTQHQQKLKPTEKKKQDNILNTLPKKKKKNRKISYYFEFRLGLHFETILPLCIVFRF